MSILQDKDLISSFAESVGIKKLEKEVEDLILSDLESKVLEILQESKKIMRHSKRDYLKTDDVKLSMEKLSIPNMFGYPSTVPYTYERVPDQQNLWFVKSQNINLKELAIDHKLHTPLDSTTYKIYIQALDGNQPKIAETIEEREIPAYMQQQQRIAEQVDQNIIRVDPQEEFKKEEERKEQQRLQSLERSKQHFEQRQAQTQQPTKELNAQYLMFIEQYQKLDKSLITGDQHEQAENDLKMKVQLKQMEETPALCSIFPNLAKFIEEKNRQIVQNIDIEKKSFTKSQALLLQIIQSMIKNNYFGIETIVVELLKVVTAIIFRDIPDTIAYNEDEVLELKDNAAFVMHDLYVKTKGKLPDLKTQLVNLCLSRLFREQINQMSQQNQATVEVSGLIIYGALTSLRTFGAVITRQALIPNLINLSVLLRKKSEIYNGANSRQIYAIQKAFEVLKNECILIVQYLRTHDKTNEEGLKKIIQDINMVFGQQLDQLIQ
eukprot:403372730